MITEHDAKWPPEQIGYLWDWFITLSGCRDSSMGIGPISHLEIESWARLMQIDPPVSPFEISIIKRIDDEFRIYRDEKDNPKPPSLFESLKATAAATPSKVVVKEKPRGSR